MLRRKKDDVLDLPGKVRTWVPVSIDDAPAKAHAGFLEWYAASNVERPNDREFLSRLTKETLHK